MLSITAQKSKDHQNRSRIIVSAPNYSWLDQPRNSWPFLPHRPCAERAASLSSAHSRALEFRNDPHHMGDQRALGNQLFGSGNFKEALGVGLSETLLSIRESR